MAAWLSIAKTPPSTVYPPDGAGTWFARTDIPQAIQTTAMGRALTIIELRGWLAEVASDCYSDDPDWHYYVELDADWLDTLGVESVTLVRPGDLLGRKDLNPYAARKRAGVVAIGVELDAWQRHDLTRGQPPQPADWNIGSNVPCGDPAALWPFDPRLDVHGTPLTVGQYVRMVGSLVTDHPHARLAPVRTGLVLLHGVAAAASLMTQDQLVEASANAAKLIWMESIADSDPGNPARWGEIHSLDYIEVLERDPAKQKLRRRQLHQVVVCAQNGLVSGQSERAVIDLPGPPDRGPNMRLRCRRHSSSWTNQDTVITGPTVTTAYGHATVDVTVQGAAAMGNSGKYAEVFELWWEDVSVAPVRYGATLRLTHALTGCHLHSHPLLYGHPGSSNQQQVTCVAEPDDNDLWRIKSSDGQPDDDRAGQPIQTNDIVRLEHLLTRRNLHSHAGIPSPVTGQQEVTSFGNNGVGDGNDNWRIEVGGGGQWLSNSPLRLIHIATEHALHSHRGFSHPQWTAGQQEVTGFEGRDDNDLWFATDLLPRDARFVYQAPPAASFTGQRQDVTIRMRNTGTETWTPGQYRLGDPGDIPTWGPIRVELPGSITPGETAAFHFRVTAPATPGMAVFQWQMLQEGVTWFGERTPHTRVPVMNVDTVLVPEVREMRRKMATDELRAVGLTATFSGGGIWIISQSPAAGSAVKRGSTVACRLGNPRA